MKKIIFPKTLNINKSTISLDDAKWKIYKTVNEKTQRNKDINNINEKMFNNNKNIDNIKSAIYSKINQNSSRFEIILEKNKQLMKENAYLKQVIRNKDKLIYDFGILFQQFKEKFIKFDEINQSLKIRLINKNKKENMEENINIIENDYLNKLKEKDKMLEKMNQELIYLHNEYKNLTNNLEQVNNYINNSDYIELKNKINDLSKENDYLIKQNKRREKRIIDLIRNNENENKNEEIENKENLVVTFKNQENEFIKTINMLQNRIIDKDKEIKMIKEEFKKILNE